MMWNYTLPIGLLTSIVPIDVEALIPNWIVTWPLVDVLRLTDLSMAYRAWN